jgi:hypothetical protein
MVEASEWTTLRVIRVPPRYHRKYKFWKLKPFHVGAAVNVGIRRALGTFILPIASDIFLSDACLKQMAQQDLNEDSFYRCDRCDIDPSILNQFTSTHDFQRNEFFKRCEQLIQAHHRLLIQSPEFDIADLHTNGSGDFCLVSRKKMHEIRGFKEGKDAGGLDIDSLVLHGLHGLGCYQTILPDDCRVYKIAHSKSTAHSVHQKWRWWEKYLDAYLTKRCSIKIVNNTRMWLNYPKRQFKHIPGATFDSFETNFIKPARRWYQKKPPFYLNNEHWGLIGENLEEQAVDKGRIN